MKRIILASSSPRRRKLFAKLGLKFETAESKVRERKLPGKSAIEIAEFFSRKKALKVLRRNRSAVVIAADTVISCGERIFGKPSNRKEAEKMLSFLSGKKHSVITAFTVIDGDKKSEVTKFTETRVYFRKILPEEIKRYVATGEPLDKAGAYAIQGGASLFIKKISGDYYSVVGLPLYALSETLRKLSIFPESAEGRNSPVTKITKSPLV